MDLFSHSESNASIAGQSAALSLAPLAERLRPKTFEDFIGQERFSDPQKPLLKNLSKQNIQCIQ